MKYLVLFIFLIPSLLPAQSRKQRKAIEAQQKADLLVVNSLKSHINNLTTPEQGQPANYLAEQFRLIGLRPKGSEGYLQPFLVNDGKQIDTSTILKVNGATLVVNKDYFPLPYSASASVAGMPAMALREKGVPWFEDVKDWLEESATKPDFDLDGAIQKEANRAAAKGATALLLYNSNKNAGNIAFNSKKKIAEAPIPVVYIMADGYNKYLQDPSNLLDIELKVVLKEKDLKGANIVGYLENNAASTTIIAASYPSRPNVNPSVTPPTTTAEGAAILIELAKMLASSTAKNNNYLFIAFDGQENGKVASSYWIKNSNGYNSCNYAISLNTAAGIAVGKRILIQGMKTSTSWPETFTMVSAVDAVFDSTSALSPIQAVFVEKELPVISFANSSEIANPETDLEIIKTACKLIESADAKGKLAFLKPAPIVPAQSQTLQASSTLVTNKTPTAPVPQTNVSLGVIADRSYAATGLKINGVSPKKLAAKIGLQPGDVLISLGGHRISNMKTYMEALANFRPGDKTILAIKRGNEEKEFAVEF